MPVVCVQISLGVARDLLPQRPPRGPPWTCWGRTAPGALTWRVPHDGQLLVPVRVHRDQVPRFRVEHKPPVANVRQRAKGCLVGSGIRLLQYPQGY